MFLFKNRNDPKPSEANFHARLSHSKQLPKNIHTLILASFRLLARIQWPYRKPRRATECIRISIKQVDRRRDRTPARTVNIQSVKASVGESQVGDITPVWHLSITESRLMTSISLIVMRCCPTVRVRHRSDLERVPHFSAQRAWGNQLFPHNFAKCWAIFIFFSKQTQQ